MYSLDKHQILFNPFKWVEDYSLINKFINNEIHFIIFTNTGLHLKNNELTALNDKLNIDFRASVIASIFNRLGIKPITYEGENNGQVFRKVTPVKLFEKSKSSFGSKKDLGFHVDNNHLSLAPERKHKKKSKAPDYLSLLCIRNEEKIPTMISDISKAINSLSNKDIKNLMSDNFTVNYPDSFSANGNVQAPIIVKDRNGYYSRFDAAFTTPNNNDVKKSFDKLNDLLNKKYIDVNLESGDILIFRNQKIVHGRKKFTPKYNGFDRYLIRLFGVDSLDNLVSVSKYQPYHSISV